MKNYIVLAFVLVGFLANAQPWNKNLPEQKSRYSYTLYDYQNAFKEFWKDKNVDLGYYHENGVKRKAYGWKQFRRWENFWESRVHATSGEFPSVSDYQIADKQYQEQLIHKSTSGNWTSLGPTSSTGGYAGIGRVNCIAFHPSDLNTFWVGTPAGGLWKTSNGGNSWTVLTDDNAVLGVSAIVIPTDYAISNTIYIGTGDRDAFDNVSVGVLKSSDGGSTWSSTGLTFSPGNWEEVNAMLILPGNNNTIYTATTDGLYKTVNAGVSWTKLNSYEFIDIEFKPGNSTYIYASTTEGKIYRSTNGGSSFSVEYNGTASGATRIELAVSPNNTSYVYALVANDNYGLKSVMRSSNSGGSYTNIYNNLNLLGWDADGLDAGGQGWYDLALAVDPNNANVVYCGGINTWKSTNGGTSWTLANHWSGWGTSSQTVHADKHALVFQNSTSKLFECNDGGVYYTNNGTSWTDKSNGIVNSQIYRLSCAQTVSNSTLLGLQDNGTKLQKTNATFEDVVSGDGTNCIISHTSYTTQYAAYVYGQIYRTTNLWNTATDIKPNNTGYGAWITPYIMDPNNHLTIYAGYENVWKSTNQGNNWTEISSINTSDNLRSMAIAPSNTQYLYVADYDDIWRTSNGGTNWINVTGSLPVGSASIKSIAVKSDDPNTAWITFSGYNSYGVYRTSNAGASWTNISSGLPSIPVNVIVQNKQNTVEVELYAGTDFGVYMKFGSADWQLFNSGMPKVVVTDLDIYYGTTPLENELRAATYGRGLWESDLYTNVNAVYDLQVLTSISPEVVPVNIGSPVEVSTLIKNVGPDYAQGVDVTLSVIGVNTYTAVQNIPYLANGDSTWISFSYQPVQSGMDLISVEVPVDDDTTNNVVTSICSVNNDIQYSYTSDTIFNEEFGFGTGSGYILSKYYLNGTATVKEVEVYIAEGSGNQLKPVMLSSTGSAIGIGSTHTIDTAEVRTWIQIPFFNSVTVTNDFIYIGVEQIANSSSAYNPVGAVSIQYQYPGAFYYSNGGGASILESTQHQRWGIAANFCQLPAQPGTITGVLSGCEGTTEQFYVSNVAGSVYSWYLPAGWSGASTTNSINATVGYSGGDIEVVTINSCGTSPPRSKTVSAYALPEIIAQPDSLDVVVGGTAEFVVDASGYNLEYAWEHGGTQLINGNNISGADSETLTINPVSVADAGNYHCLVFNLCSSEETYVATLNVSNELTSEDQDLISIYPNPVSSKLIVESGTGISEITILSLSGQVIRSIKKPATNRYELSRKGIATGAYFIQVISGNRVLNEKIVFE
jgi:hypothetical protein